MLSIVVVAQQMDKLREEQLVSQKSHNGRHHALDIQKLEMEELKRALADHADVLQATEAAHIRVAAPQAREHEQDMVVASLEVDLTHITAQCRKSRSRLAHENARRDAEDKVERGRAYKEVDEARREQGKELRERKQVGTELRLVHEQLDLLEGEKKPCARHVCTR
jgi:myosin protein heavy chain